MEEIDYGAIEIYPGVSIRNMQQKIKGILVYFMQLCEENNLRYWCTGGTMLGAIRHKGFIPWDDDIDVFMPRSDYERLYAIWPSIGDKKRYSLCRTTKEKVYHQTDMQLVDLNTTFINKHSVNEDIEHGLSIDIMPFEGVPDSKIARGIQIYHAIMYSVFNVQRLPDHQGKLLRSLTAVLLSLAKSPEKRYRIWKHHETKFTQYDFDQSNSAKEMVTTLKALFHPYPREMFTTIDVEFEDLIIKIPKGYDLFMRTIYGNYMELPPEKDRVPKHEVAYANLEEPFSQYKGIYYCKS